MTGRGQRPLGSRRYAQPNSDSLAERTDVAGTISVPERAHDIVRRLGKVSENERNALGAALMSEEGISSPQHLVKVLTETIGQDWGQEEVTTFASELFSMAQLLQESHTPDDIAQSVAGFPQIGLDENEREAAAAVLSTLLSSRAVTNIASAAYVQGEHDRLFLNARVFVDTRPVFDLYEGDVAGALVVRKLRLGYFEEGRVREIELALDGDSVSALRKSLDKSDEELAKAESLYHSINLRVFRFESDED